MSYFCGICKTKPDQISHHKSHLETQKHIDKKEVFELKLSKMTNDELQEKYGTNDIDKIILETETIIYNFKKLKNNLNENSYDTQQDELNMIQECNSISNKEALKEKIHEIHNFLRNNGAGYGMNALKVFNIIYGLKKIEENNLLDRVNLERPACEFSYLLQLANDNEDERLASTIFQNVLDSLASSNLRDILFYEIPKKMKGSVLGYLIKEINEITIIERTCNVLLSGKIYEYFIGRDATAISELGAYFTDRHIVEYILSKLNPSLNEDGTVPTMIDMFGGSGGFTTGYLNYLNEKYLDEINWETELSKVHHYDMNEDVIKSAGLEFFCLTGTLPNMTNLTYKNSFNDEFENKKFMYPLTNPPYGGDKNNKTDTQTKRDKIKEYIKKELSDETINEALRIKRQRQLKNIEVQEKQDKKDSDKTKVSLSTCSNRINRFARQHKLKGNDKESCSLILLMDIVDVEGTAIGILKEGVFFNKTYKDIRKCLVENYNVREIISVPQNQFENTSTKTSIIIFDNTEEKTTEVIFRDLIVEKYDEDVFGEFNDEIVIVENRGDIKCVIDEIVSQATKEEILSNQICSLNSKDYNKKEIIVGEGYELVKLGDICQFLPKSKRKASYGQEIGQYNFYTSSEKVQKCDEADYNEECLIIGSGGIANIKIDSQFSCSADNLLVKSNHNKYIYYLLSGKMELLSHGFSGSTLKHLSKDYLKNIEIPIPKCQEKMEEWMNKISQVYNKKNIKQQEIKELELLVQNRIKNITENEECDEVELGCICELNPEIMKDNQFSKINYIDIRSVKGETINNIQVFTKKFPSRAKRIIKKNDILFSTVRPNLKCYTLIYDNIENCIASSGFVVIRCDKINPKYIYTLLKDDKITEYLILNSTGTQYPAVNPSIFDKIKIKIPQNRQLIQEMEEVFKQIENLQNELKIAEELYNQYINELSQEAMPSQINSKQICEEEISNVNENTHQFEETKEEQPQIIEQDDDIEISFKPNKITKNKKSKKDTK